MEIVFQLFDVLRFGSDASYWCNCQYIIPKVKKLFLKKFLCIEHEYDFELNTAPNADLFLQWQTQEIYRSKLSKICEL